MNIEGNIPKKEQKNIVIVLAAGQGRRMGTKIQKQFLHICGKPVIYYSLKCFQESPNIDSIILVTENDTMSYCRQEIVEKYGFDKVERIVPGGEERYHSVYEGLKACEGCSYVFIHDGARPFINEEIISQTLEAAKKYQACVTGVPAKDTIKISNEENFIEHTPARDRVWVVQTPQVFAYELVYEAYSKSMEMKLSGMTDDAMVVETVMKCPVRLVEGSYKNIKITTPEDLETFEMFIKKGC